MTILKQLAKIWDDLFLARRLQLVPPHGSTSTGSPFTSGGLMVSYELPYPNGYYVVEHKDTYILYRPDNTKIRYFDKTIVEPYELILSAFEDHSELLSGHCTAPHVEHPLPDLSSVDYGPQMDANVGESSTG